MRLSWGTASDGRISERNVFNQWVHSAIYLENAVGFESGGGVISDNVFIGYITGTYGIYSECGYVKICNNRIVGCSAAFALISTNGSAGGFEVFQNQIEEQTTYGIQVTRTAVTDLAAMVQIKNNQFSNIVQTGLIAHIAVVDAVGGDWIDSVSITGNVMRSALGNASAYIICNSSTAITCDMNEIHHFGAGTATGISIKGAAVKVPASAYQNRFYGLVGPRYDNSTAVVVMDNQGMTFAQAAALQCANGSVFYVTDGTPNTNPLTGAGTGAIVKKLNGVLRSD